MALSKNTIKREKHSIDVTDQVLGRVATRIATILRGKHKACFEPHKDCGDFVVITGISGLKFSGKKLEQKVYHRYSGYPGGLKTEKLSYKMKQKPHDVLRHAVYQMLPPNRLRKAMMKRLIIEK